MFTAEQFRAKAAEYAELLRHTDNPNEVRDLNRLKESFTRLAENEDWLAHNFDRIVHSQDIVAQAEADEKPVDRRTVAEIEEHVLRCLGAAVIMQWNTIPTKLQRELFDTAGSLGDVLKTAALRGQIARFLHNQKDGKGPENGLSESIIASDKFKFTSGHDTRPRGWSGRCPRSYRPIAPSAPGHQKNQKNKNVCAPCSKVDASPAPGPFGPGPDFGPRELVAQLIVRRRSAKLARYRSKIGANRWAISASGHVIRMTREILRSLKVKSLSNSATFSSMRAA